MGLIEKIEKVMSERDISRMEFAKRADIPYTTVVNFFEKGVDNVKLSTLRKLADFIGCTLDELVMDVEREKKTVDLLEIMSSDYKLTFGGKDITPEQLTKLRELVRIMFL